MVAGGDFAEMAENEVKRAIERPTLGIVYQDATFSNRFVYYSRKRGKRFYIKVVVEFEAENPGTVITAFLTDAPKSGEKMVWPESSL